MDSARWERIQTLFHEAADQPTDQRRSFLKSAASGDEQLIAEVLALLEEDARGSSLLDRDVARVASEMLSPAALLASQDFGPYRLREVLGEGGMGVVYLAEREDLGSRVAIKVLRDAWMSPARCARFASEQRTLAQLTHPSIARLYDADTLADGTPWFAMEYVKGVPLTEYCVEFRSSIEERLKLFRSVCEAVQYAHSLAIIHRDLKPSNILVQSDGSVKLLDFGIAKQLDSLGTPADQTKTMVHFMTPAYAAPEQIRGHSAGIHTDVYALGVILYELLAGRLPFDVSHKTPTEAAAMMTTGQPLKPSTLARRTGTRTASWADLDVLCLTAMHIDPKRRYQSAEALIRDVDHYLRQEPLEARPDRVPYTLTKFVRRNWQGVSVAAVMIAIVAVALVVTLSSKASISKAREKTVAVLPFQNSGSDHSLDFLRLSLADEIATTLSYARSLSVRPIEATRKYVEPNLDPQKAGRDLRVANIVTGHFLRAGEQLQITLEATDVDSNRVLWRDIFVVPSRNMIAMQAQIAAKTRSGLAPLLGSSEFAADSAARPRDEEAYDLYLRSTPLSFDPAPNKQAITTLERAVKLDPDYSLAWSALAVRYYNDARYGNGGEAMIERAKAAAERSRLLDPNNITILGSMPFVRTEQGELVEAYRQAEDLVRRRPDNGRVHFGLSYVLRYAGLLEEAARECDTAFLLDAQTAGVRSCAVVFILRGDYSRATDYINLDFGSEWAKALSMDSLVRQRKEKEALKIGPAGVPQWAGYGMFLACVGHRPSNEIAALARAVEPVGDPEENYFAAAHLAYCGQTDAALAMLKRAIQGKYCSYPAIDSDPFFSNLRSKPEFAEIRSAAIACQNKFLVQRKSSPEQENGAH
ncbi:MAG: protein kinase [Acidobacteriia bacterium]|nr:protein kinase [Terriglobia bacterium]